MLGRVICLLYGLRESGYPNLLALHTLEISLESLGGTLPTKGVFDGFEADG